MRRSKHNLVSVDQDVLTGSYARGADDPVSEEGSAPRAAPANDSPRNSEVTCDPGPDVLIVEDDVEIAEALMDYLHAEGYRAEWVPHAAAALQRLQHGAPPKLVLLDLNTPVMDGWQFCARRRTDPALASIPVVVVSAIAGRYTTASVDGVSAVVPKPYAPSALLSVVRRFVPASRTG